MDYRHAIYNQPYLPYLTNKIECDFAIRNAIRGTSDNQLCLELGFESSKDRRWVRQLCHQYKLVCTEQRTDLFDLIPPFQESLQNKGCIYELLCQTVSFKNYLILYAVKKWNKLDPEIKNAETYVAFRKMLLDFIRPTGNSTY